MVRSAQLALVALAPTCDSVRLTRALTPEDDPLEIELARAVELIHLKKIANATRDLGEHLGEMTWCRAAVVLVPL